MSSDALKSKSDLLYEQLREDICAGVYKAGAKLPRETEFARQHKVALLTLRSALSKLEVDGLIARLPRSGTFVMGPGNEKKRVIQLRILNYHGDVKEEKYFNQALILGVANYAYLHNCELLVVSSDQDAGKLKLQYQQGEYMGIIWDRPQPELYEEIEELARINVPQICINRHVKGTVELSCDYPDAIRQSMRFLRQLGHKDVALLDLDLPGDIFKERQEEFLNQLRFMGIEEPEQRLLRLPYPAKDAWLMIADKLRCCPEVTAVIVSYTHIEEFVRYIEEAQLHVPRDLSVILWGESNSYNLKSDSSYSILTESRFDVGNTAVELLIKISEDKDMPKSEYLISGDLIMRSSCGLPRNCKLTDSKKEAPILSL